MFVDTESVVPNIDIFFPTTTFELICTPPYIVIAEPELFGILVFTSCVLLFTIIPLTDKLLLIETPPDTCNALSDVPSICNVLPITILLPIPTPPEMTNAPEFISVASVVP